MIPMGYGIRYSVHTVQVAVNILIWNGTGQGWNFLIVLKVGCCLPCSSGHTEDRKRWSDPPTHPIFSGRR